MNYKDIKGRRGVGGIGSHRPSKAVVVEAVGVVKAPVAASFTDAICAPAATFGGEGVGAVASSAAACASGWRCRRRWCFPSLQRPFSRSALGLGCRWGDWRRGEPRTASPGPHLSFIALCDRGPPTM